MSGDDFNLRAAKGQAYNLAVHHALVSGDTSMKNIYSLFIKYYELGQLLQSASIDEIKESLKNEV